MLKATTILKTVLIAAITFLVSACGDQSARTPSSATSQQLVMPLLSECEQQFTTAFLSEQKNKSGLEFEFINFNLGLKPLPSLRGYIKLTSEDHSFNDLARLAQNAGAGCMPNNSRRITLQDPRFADKIIQTMSLAQREGARHLYSNISGDDLEIYFSKK